MSGAGKVAVVIPFYKAELTAHEHIALQQCFKTLSGYPIIAVNPQSLALADETKAYPFSGITKFDDSYFKDIAGYNRLMLDEAFYKAFLDYEYILIYQLDAFVFRDELNYWCSQNYDYIGAPWIKPKKAGIVKSIINQIQYYFHTRYDFKKDGIPSKKQFAYKVGNGGLSLRRTRIFHDICIAQCEKIAEYNSGDHHLFNEDIFWSIEMNRKHKVLNIPGYKTGLKFAFEFFPERALTINDGQLPFGCHAWDLTIDFWRPIFKEQGYLI